MWMLCVLPFVHSNVDLKRFQQSLQIHAGLAQLEERWSHNPKVVSSILTIRITFFIVHSIMSENTPRSLGTVILTKSITKSENLEGKILDDGSSVDVNGEHFERYGDCI